MSNSADSTPADQPEQRSTLHRRWRKPLQPGPRAWQQTVFDVTFGYSSVAGRAFDVVLIAIILLSVGAVMLDSVEQVRDRWGWLLYAAEWVFTAIFTIEYALRLACLKKRRAYALSFFGVIDLLAVLPSYLALLLTNVQYLIVVRALRLLRVFRILELVKYTDEADFLVRAIRDSRRKILVFVFAVVTLVIIVGALMYLVEGPKHGFTSIPTSIYWAVVTLTTVGYGDISPQTVPGKFLASMIMLMGYGIIAVPTGIVTASMAVQGRAAARQAGQDAPEPAAENKPDRPVCTECDTPAARKDDHYCGRCGHTFEAS